MSIRVAIRHKTEYLFDRSVALSPHLIRLRPAPHARTPIHQYSLKVEPGEHFLNWQQDPFGNFVARYVFPEKTRRMVIDVGLVVVAMAHQVILSRQRLIAGDLRLRVAAVRDRGTSQFAHPLPFALRHLQVALRLGHPDAG